MLISRSPKRIQPNTSLFFFVFTFEGCSTKVVPVIHHHLPVAQLVFHFLVLQAVRPEEPLASGQAQLVPPLQEPEFLLLALQASLPLLSAFPVPLFLQGQCCFSS